MRSFAVLATAFAAAASASLIARDSTCMSLAEAQQVGDHFKASIAAYDEALINVTFTLEFTDYSDSVNTLINSGCAGPQTLGEPTFSGRDVFEAGQGAQPAIPFEILNLWYNCDNVFLRWRTTVDSTSPQFVTGIIALEAVAAPAGAEYPWLINTVYSEFNSGAWLVDLHAFTPANCSTSSSSRRLIRA